MRIPLAILALYGAGAASAATSTIGRTYPIVEIDALSEIEARTAKLPPNLGPTFGPRSSWSALKSAQLDVARQTRVRSVVPFYTLPDDIKLPDGRLLYPRGFTFNPLAYTNLAQRLIVVAPRDLAWGLAQARPQDWVILTAGGDVVELSERSGRPLFVLEERVKERMGLTVAPVIVRQVGHKLELSEFALDHRASRAPIRSAALAGRSALQ